MSLEILGGLLFGEESGANGHPEISAVANDALMGLEKGSGHGLVISTPKTYTPQGVVSTT